LTPEELQKQINEAIALIESTPEPEAIVLFPDQKEIKYFKIPVSKINKALMLLDIAEKQEKWLKGLVFKDVVDLFKNT
jgi:hypothetical protein